jgi:predicted Zn-dependent protease
MLAAGRADGCAHMTEGRRGGQDSRPEENELESGQAAGGGHRPPPGASDPDGDVQTWYRRGLDLLGNGSPAAAAQLLERAADAEPDSRMVREALARAQFDAGWYAAAAVSFRMIVEASPADDYAHFGLGLALARSGAPGEAAEYLALAAAMRPDLPHYTQALRGVRATLRARDQAAGTEGRSAAAAGETG